MKKLTKKQEKSLYEMAREDFEFLETLAPLDDQVTIMDEVQNFMRDPTIEFARKLYESSITLWFFENGLMDGTEEIAESYLSSESLEILRRQDKSPFTKAEMAREHGREAHNREKAERAAREQRELEQSWRDNPDRMGS